MAYDDALAARIRELFVAGPVLNDDTRVTELRMFGGLAFLVNGNMAIAAAGEGGILVRVDPAESDRIVASTAAEVAIMRGRPMAGWLRVPSKGVGTNRQLGPWVRRGAAYAATLPPKG